MSTKKRTLSESSDNAAATEIGAVGGNNASNKKKKALPPGYTCKACGKIDDHAIYDCPLAIKKKKEEKEAKAVQVEQTVLKVEAKTEEKVNTQVTGANAEVVAAPKREVSPFTVFVTGLPFTTTKVKVVDVFKKKGFADDLCPKDVTLLSFPDQPERCRGLAYVVFHSDEDYKKALALNGMDYEGKVLKMLEYKEPAHKTEPKEDSKRQFKKQNFQPRKGEKPTHCYRCGGAHDVNQCTNQRVCYRCRGTDHLSSQCPMKGQPKKK